MSDQTAAQHVFRMQIETVFGLTGGELADKPWQVEAVSTNWRAPHTFAFWYEGAPDYDRVRAELALDGWLVVTLVCYGLPPLRLEENGVAVWERAAYYVSSGEAPCPGMQSDEPGYHLPCPLCEGVKKHEHVYLGDGWMEAVYVCVAEPIEGV